jgi:hypothetical protein
LTGQPSLHELLTSGSAADFFHGDNNRDAAFAQRFFSDLLPTFRFTANLPMPVENDIHGLGMRDHFGLAVDLDVIGAVELLAVHQQRNLRVALDSLDLVGRVSGRDVHVAIAAEKRRRNK